MQFALMALGGIGILLRGKYIFFWRENKERRSVV
jgi:hypothetical protein